MVRLRELVSVAALFLFFLFVAMISLFVAELFRGLGKAIGALILGLV